MASEIAQIEAGTRLSGLHRASFRAARIEAAIRSTRLRPLSTDGSLARFVFCSPRMISANKYSISPTNLQRFPDLVIAELD